MKVNTVFNKLTSRGYLTALLVVNFSVFILINIGLHLFHIDLTPVLAMPLSEREFLFKPWTLFTYMFLHIDFFHLLFNLLLLYFAGEWFQSMLGQKRLLYLYIMGGLFGGAFLLLMQLIFPIFAGHYLMGASAAVMAIIVAQAIYTPNAPVQLFFVIQIPFKYFAIITFILSTLIDFTINTGGKITHIGGALFGLAYALYLKNGFDFLHFSFLKSKNTLIAKRKFKSEDEYLDFLLDKISKRGYHALSKDEKADLFRISQKK